MIAESAGVIAAAIAAQLGEGVTVHPVEPETAAAPCVWLTFTEARWQSGGWTVTFDATVVADAGLGAVDAQAALAAMTDAVLALEAPGVSAIDMSARGGGLTARIGDTAHPCTVVTIPQHSQVC